ncbi:8957_t:CDS:2, partial [Ambispora gerdemannii]
LEFVKESNMKTMLVIELVVVVNIKEELKKCTSKSEYDAKRQNYIRQCEEAESGLKTKTGPTSSMFNICIIWSDEATNKTVESK